MTITKYDNSSLYYEGTIDYYTLTVPANTVYGAGTLLGEVSTTGKLATFRSDATDGSQVPVAILRNEVNNTKDTALELTVSVIILGKVNANRLIFSKPEDNLTTLVPNQGLVKTLLKNNGILAITNQDLTE